MTAFSLYDHLDRHMKEVRQRPIFATHLSNNIPLRLCTPAPTPQAAPLSERTAKTLHRLVTDLDDDESIFMVSESAEAEFKRFFYICQEAWEETKAFGCLKDALGVARLGAYVHAGLFNALDAVRSERVSERA